MIEDILRGAQAPIPAYTRDQRAEDNRRLHERIDQVAVRRAATGCKGSSGLASQVKQLDGAMCYA
ncbi:hypothetical protein ACFO9E_00160 [Streptomyces maoxianensis]|uniref:Uncharacterized protein n=1 Tax=Streptomyces maoxianensis TaxID=1459942 RepID=A0ABV9FZ16_9ACTN